MRRALLLAGLATGTVALFTVLGLQAHQRDDRVREFKNRLSDLTYCRTGLDIASSEPHYRLRWTENAPTKIALLQLSDKLAAKSDQLSRLIDQHIANAPRNISPVEREILVKQVQWQAELEVTRMAGWVEEPQDFLDHINGRCDDLIS